jgi:hypothetical protein
MNLEICRVSRVRKRRDVLSREEHTVVDNYGRGRTADGHHQLLDQISFPFSLGDHKRSCCVASG